MTEETRTLDHGAPTTEPLSEHRRAWREAVKEYSGEASGVIRQLSYAGIALAWIFHLDVGGAPAVPQQIMLPLFLLVLTLAFDLFQYLSGMAVGYFRLDVMERRQLGAVRATLLGFLHRHPPVRILFGLKAVSLILAYTVLLYFFAGRLLAV